MRNQRGFTIVELAIVIAIMAVLLVIGVASLRSSQVTARDHERESDVKNIARFLEDYYKNNQGTYPATAKIASGSIDATFDGFDKSNLKAPGQQNYSITGATSETNKNPTKDKYIYMPLIDAKYKSGCAATKSTCGVCELATDTCRSFTIYYRTEGDNVVKSVESEHQ